jgi:8-amino-7-oxononanoate synthase
MAADRPSLTKLTMEEKRALALRLLGERAGRGDADSPPSPASQAAPPLDQNPAYLEIKQQLGYFDLFGVDKPFFRTHEDVSGDRTTVNGRQCINFSGFNYLGLSGHPEVSVAAKNAIDRYGTSASASRLAGGQIPLHLELEREIARTLGVEESVTFASGYATNVAAIGHLFGPKDLLVHDSLIHRSMLTGAQLAGARRLPFPHNDWQVLDRILSENRQNYRYAAVLIEGVYSMEGDIADLPKFIAIKQRHNAFLMVDEAHSFGVLGKRGFGVIEHFGLDPNDVEIWMGTLSKGLASSGGYIAGKTGMVEYLKFTAPGFVFAAAMTPPDTAAALAAVRMMKSEPQRVARLRENSRLFLELAKACDLPTGTSGGSPIVPVITGDSAMAVWLSDELFKQGILAQPIVHPAVEHAAARVRFFINALHSEEDIRTTVEAVALLMAQLRESPLQIAMPARR